MTLSEHTKTLAISALKHRLADVAEQARLFRIYGERSQSATNREHLERLHLERESTAAELRNAIAELQA